jgi:hypothetical protein
MKILIDTYLSYIKVALVTLLCTTAISLISAGIRSTSIFFTGNSAVSIDILSVVSGVLLFALIGFGIIWWIISPKSHRVLEIKDEENLTEEYVRFRENQEILLRHKVAYILLTLFALNAFFTLGIIFLVGFGVIGLPKFLLITILGITTAQVGAGLRLVTKYLFPGDSVSTKSHSGYHEAENNFSATRKS